MDERRRRWLSAALIWLFAASLVFGAAAEPEAARAASAPVASDGSDSTRENTPLSISLVATDDDGDTLGYTIVDGPGDGTLSGTGPDLTYTPDAAFAGPDSFTWMANDGTADSNVATFSITVVANNPPVASNDDGSTRVNTQLAVSLNASDDDNDDLTYTIVDPPGHGALTGTAPDLTYTPAAAYAGPDSFTWKANDGFDDSNTATFSITVVANNPPVASGGSDSTRVNTQLDVSLIASDADDDPLDFTIVDPPAHGSLGDCSEGSCTYTPTTGYTGTDSFTWKANDGFDDSNVATFDITVSANTPPDASDDSGSTRVDRPLDLSLFASDNEGDVLSYTIVAPPGHGTLTGTAPNLTYTPNAGYTGLDSFTWKANDGLADSNTATFSITIVANTPPQASDGEGSIRVDKALSIGLFASDNEGDLLSYTILDPPAHGTLSGTAPNLTYTPEAGYVGPDTFTWKANDGLTDSNTATFTITVTPNGAPVATDQSGAAFSRPLSIALSASDPDADPLNYTIVTGPSHGTLDDCTTGSCTYTPTAGYVGPDSFTWKANDGTDDSNVATFSITVIANRPFQNFTTVFATDFVHAGFGGMRNDGTGTLTVSGVSGSVSKAYLYWHGPTNSINPAANAAVTLAGNAVTGTNIGFSNDNCWGFSNSQAYRADVTSLVTGNGSFALDGFVKGGDVANINGVSLIVFYGDGNAANNRDVVLFDGNDSNINNTFDADGWNVSLTGINYTSGTANITMHVSDGQSFPDAALVLNASTLVEAGPIFEGDSVPFGSFDASGHLWDIKAFDVTTFLTPGPNTLTLTTGVDDDCLSLVVAAIDLPAGAAPPPPPELTLTKTVDNTGGGTALATDWTLSATGPTTISGSTGAPAVTNAVVSPGTYTLAETGPTGYSASAWSCTDGTLTGNSLVLAAGDDASCSITNTFVPSTAELTLTKTVGNTGGGTALATDWTLSATGPTAISGSTGAPAVTNAVVSPGTYTLAETGPTGYSASAWSCTDGTLTGSSLVLAAGDAASCSITNTFVPPTVVTLTLEPLTASNPLETEHTVTATLTSGGMPVTDITVSFTTVDGPHFGTNGSDVTDAEGKATFSYTGTIAGTDTLRASATVGADSITSNDVTKTWLGEHTLTVGILGSGSVTSDPAGIACLPTCVASFTDGASVTLTPVAQPGFTFLGWSGDCTGSVACVVTLDADRSVTARFTAPGCIGYADFTSTAGLNLGGDAAAVDGVLRLTPAQNFTQGQAWLARKVDLSADLVSDFSIRFTEQGGSQGADGITFAIQNASATASGQVGGGIGYEGLLNSIVVELDTFDNGVGAGDADGNHVSVHTAGSGINGPRDDTLRGAAFLTPDLEDGAIHRVRVVYDSTATELRIYVDDLATPALTVDVNIAATLDLDAGAAWVGFTSATGGGFENHDVLDWSLCAGTGAEGLALSLAPISATNNIGTAHTVTATLTDDGSPLIGTSVAFEILDGPHAGTTGVATTNASGQADFAWTGTAAGTDTIRASATINERVIRSNTATKTWVDNPPPTVDAGADIDAGDLEGASVSLDATVSNEPASDTLTTTWSFAPGAGVDAGATCIFGDLNAVDTTVTCTDDGAYELTLTADDGANPAVTDSLLLTLGNANPVVTITAPLEGATTGATVSISASFTDAGANDTHTCQIDWADGPAAAGTITAGVCSGSHTYTTSGPRVITVTVTDDDGGVGSDTVSITVELVNTPPTVDAGADIDAGDLEGASVSLDATVSNEPASDTLTTTWSFAPGAGVDAGATCIFGDLNAVDTTVTCTDDGAYELTLTADDGANPAVTDSLLLTLGNANPVVTITAPLEGATTGATVSISASFTDAGANDTHTCQIDWADGPAAAGTVTAGVCSGSHTYTTSGPRVITVTVTDDDGGIGTDTVSITVQTTAPDCVPTNPPNTLEIRTEPGNLRLDALPATGQPTFQSNTCLFGFAERKDVTLDRNLLPAAPRATNMAVSSPPTRLIPAGTVVDSYLIHGDSLGLSGASRATLTGSWTFDEPILGVFMGRDNLVISDALVGLTGTPGLTYERTLAQRGVEFDSTDVVRVTGPNTIEVTFDFTAMDEIRVFTGTIPPDCVPTSPTNTIVAGSPPGNLRLDGLPATGQPTFQSDTCLYLFAEGQDVTLDRNLNPIAPRATNMAVANPPTRLIAAGTVVDSYLIHGDALGSSATATGTELSGTWTFDQPILGVFMGRDNLVISDALVGLNGTPGLTYERTLAQRGLEFGSADAVTVPSPNTIVVNFAFTAMDEIRVFTGAPAPDCVPDDPPNALAVRTAPGNLRLDGLPATGQPTFQSNTCLFAFAEGTDVTLDRNLNPIAPRATNMAVANPPTRLIPVNTVVDSYLIHADSLGASGSSAATLTGTWTFDEPILGVFMGRDNLVITDALVGLTGTPGLTYERTSIARGLELGSNDVVRVTGPNTIEVTFDFNAMDELRVLTGTIAPDCVPDDPPNALAVRTAPGNLRLDGLPATGQPTFQSNTCLFAFAEGTDVTLDRNLNPIAPRATNMAVANPPTRLIPVNTVVDSYLIHADSLGASGSSAATLTGTWTFDEPILGVFMGRDNLVITDALVGLTGTPGLTYERTSIARGLELGSNDVVRVTGPNTIEVTFDFNAMDELRVLTGTIAPDCVPDDPPNALAVRTAPGNLRLDGLPATGQPTFQSNTCLFAFAEGTDVTLDRNLNPIAPRATNMAVANPPTRLIPVNTVVDSYLIHADSLGASGSSAATLTGTWTFDEPILGVFMGRDNLVITDALVGLTGTPGLTYERTSIARGLELGSNDVVRVTGPNTIEVTFDFNAMDEIRVLTGTIAPPTGSITIIKDAVPNDAQDFVFTGLGGFTLDDDADPTRSDRHVASGLASGNYDVTETAVPGWSTGIQCNDTDGGTTVEAATVHVDLDPGQNITCTFTNARDATVTIIKDAVPNHAQDFGFTGSFGPFSLDDDTDPTLLDRRTFTVSGTGFGAKTVTETALAGWSLTGLVCSEGTVTGATASVTVDPGDVITCTFTNTKDATVTIVKDAVPNGPQDFGFTGSFGPFSLDDDTDPTLLDRRTFTVSGTGFGTKTVTETAIAGWTPTVLCSEGTVTGVTATLTVDPGDVITCTFTNTQDATVTIIKDAQPNHAQDFAFTGSFGPFNLDDDIDPTLLDRRTFTVSSTAFGTKTVTEAAVAGWSLTVLDCTGTVETSDLPNRTTSFTVNAGDVVVCTFTNARDATVTIIKDAVPNHAQDFGFTGSFGPFSLDDDTDPTLLDRRTFTVSGTGFGAKTVTETALAGWSLTGLVCSEGTVTGATASVTVDPGDVITCTFTNTKDATVTIVKDAVPNGPQDFGFTGSFGPFSLDDDTDPTLLDRRTFTVSGTAFGAKTVTETLVIRWEMTQISCVGDSEAVVSLPTRTVTLDVDPGETITCTYRNTFIDIRPFKTQRNLSQPGSSAVTTAIPVQLGDTVRYVIGVNNVGTAAAPSTVITDFIPARLRVTSLGGCVAAPPAGPGTTITCDLGPIPAGQTRSATIEVQAVFACDIVGTRGNDTINFAQGVTNNGETICGGGGRDNIFGQGGNDFIYGNQPTLNMTPIVNRIWVDLDGDAIEDTGETAQVTANPAPTTDGADTIEGGTGNDWIDGQDADDELHGQDGADEIHGNVGDDTITGDAGIDTITGDDHDDTINGGTGSDVINGGSGADSINGGDQGDNVFGGLGNDTIAGESLASAAPGPDILRGEGGNDTINGAGANDVITGGDGADILRGSDGNDDISGNDGADNIAGGDGVDSITGGEASDVLSGNDGNDTIDGNNGNDVIDGGADLDMLEGNDGADEIDGGGESDYVSGGDGNDQLWGGLGSDIVLGGGDNDRMAGDVGVNPESSRGSPDHMNGGPGRDLMYGQGGNDCSTLLGEGTNPNHLSCGAQNRIPFRLPILPTTYVAQMFGGSEIDRMHGGELNDRLDGGPAPGGNALVGGDGRNDFCSFGPPPGDPRAPSCEWPSVGTSTINWRTWDWDLF